MSRAPARWRSPGRGLVGAAALAAALAGPLASRAFAYIQYQVVDQNTGLPTGVRIHWNRSCIDITAYPNDLAEMTPEQVEQAASAAAATWSKGTLSCTYLDIRVSASFDATRASDPDPYNVLIFRNPWCDPAKPEHCQPEALAVTSVFAGSRTGIIHDADIEVNSENFVWGDLEAQPGVGKQDLQNALTHEMGHLIGLDHDCYTPNSDTFRQTDNNGAPAPFCISADATVQEATMFTKAEFGDLSKRTLADDDMNGVCGIYPAAQDPNYCPPPGTVEDGSGGGCGCHVDPAGRIAPPLLPAGLLVALAATRARRRRR
ncbi:MAG TPA: MYXO-CTERM sorting domain-containing protein [Polyangia bacterium]|jgi:MYXO-CTERM domain-containing protein|nr:MYXO-CTERM sorting domain-containing protein [Polyangia bacterium]